LKDHKIVKELRDLCKKEGIELIERPNKHFQINGPLLVNYWPLSCNKTCYVKGTTGGKKGCSPKEAVKMCKVAPSGLKAGKRKGNSRAKRKAMLRKSNSCCWCGCQLTLDTSTIEHVVPLSIGGLENSNNTKLACKDCNEKRGNEMPELLTD